MAADSRDRTEGYNLWLFNYDRLYSCKGYIQSWEQYLQKGLRKLYNYEHFSFLEREEFWLCNTNTIKVILERPAEVPNQIDNQIAIADSRNHQE